MNLPFLFNNNYYEGPAEPFRAYLSRLDWQTQQYNWNAMTVTFVRRDQRRRQPTGREPNIPCTPTDQSVTPYSSGAKRIRHAFETEITLRNLWFLHTLIRYTPLPMIPQDPRHRNVTRQPFYERLVTEAIQRRKAYLQTFLTFIQKNIMGMVVIGHYEIAITQVPDDLPNTYNPLVDLLACHFGFDYSQSSGGVIQDLLKA